MKLEVEGNRVVSRGVKNSFSYQVCNSAHVMTLLSDSTYNDKVKAPVRELSTNAWDSHIQAENTDCLPIITLPTVENPEFKIRDFGTGMPYDKITTMYRTYGVSDKTDCSNANELNGCLGIGSKSPFAYVKNNPFISTSYYNGMKYTFINVRNEDGKFLLEEIYNGPTDEPNGLEVSFQVEPKDIDKFYSSVIEVMRHFPKCFTIEGREFELPERKILVQGKGWRIYEDVNEPIAVMGNVGYPIDKNKFSKWVDRSWMRGSEDDVYYLLLSTGIEMDFELGAFLPNSGREGIQYKNSTIDMIKAKLDSIKDELSESFSKNFANSPSLWDARCEYLKMISGKMQGLQGILKIAKITWNGTPIDSKAVSLKTILCSAHLFEGKSNVKMHKNVKQITPRPVTEQAIVVNDVNHGAYVACKRMLEDSDPDNRRTHVVLVKFDSDEDKNDFMNKVGCLESHFIYASTLPKPPRKKRNANGIVSDKVFRLVSGGFRSGNWVAEDIDFRSGGIYVEINRMQVVKPNGVKVDTYVIEDFVEQFYNLGVDKPVIFGIKSVAASKFRKSEKWINFFDWAVAKYYEVQRKSSFPSDELMKQLNDFQAHNVYIHFSSKSVLNRFNSRKNAFARLARGVKVLTKRYGNAKKEYNVLKSLAERLNIPFIVKTSANKSSMNLVDSYDKVIKKYPLLALISNHSWSNHTDKIVEYVNLVERDAETLSKK